MRKKVNVIHMTRFFLRNIFVYFKKISGWLNPGVLTLKNHTNTNPSPRIRGANFGIFL